MSDRSHAFEEGVSRRAFVVQVGAAAVVLGAGLPGRAQTPAPVPGPIAGKDKLIVRSPRPINLETPLRDSRPSHPERPLLRPEQLRRPGIDPAAYALNVDGEVDNPLTLRLDDLRRLPQVTQTITLECAGNGRSFHNRQASGLQWENGAVGTAVWSGVRLADVLSSRGRGRGTPRRPRRE